MKILHISDTHSCLPELQAADVVVHSGDFFPNSAMHHHRASEVTFQLRWLDEFMPCIKAWLGSRTLLFCPGNHDFADPVPAMQAAGINVISIDRQHTVFGGVSFFGLPYVRWWRGNWNFEYPESDLKRLYDLLLSTHLEAGTIDVLVSHTPMYGVLDRVGRGERCGAIALRTILQTCKVPPKALLCGHIHEQGGRKLTWSGGMLVSNAALSQRVVEVK